MAARDPGGEKQICLLLLVYCTAVAKKLRDILVRAKHRRQALPPPRLRALSVVTEICARHVLSLHKEPHLTPFSLYLPTSKDHIARLYDTVQQIQYIGETKRQLSDRFGEHRRAIEKAIEKQHIDQPTALSDYYFL